MRTIRVYKFSELNEEIQNKVINKYRYINVEHQPWWEYTYDDINYIASIIGIEINLRPNIPTPTPDIYFFDEHTLTINGHYQYRKNSAQTIKEHTNDEDLHEIAMNLQKIQSKLFYKGTAKLTHRGIDSDYEGVTTELKRFYKWARHQLTVEEEYLTGDDAVRETLIANEYEFLPDGRMV